MPWIPFLSAYTIVSDRGRGDERPRAWKRLGELMAGSVARLVVCLIATAVIALFPSGSEGASIPKIVHPVNDYAGVISPSQENRIADLLIAHRKKTGVQVAVLTVPRTGNLSIEEFSLKAAEQWGGGSKERDDGLLFTVAVNDRRMRIEVGYGLEGYVTDLRAGRILDGIRGDFRKHDFGGGIEKAVKEIIGLTDGLRAGEPVPVTGRVRGAFFRLFRYHIAFFILGALIGALFMIAKHRMKFSGWITALVSLVVFAGIPALLLFYLRGVWYWGPIVYLTGAIAGAGIVGAAAVPQLKTLALIVNLIPACISLGMILYALHVLKPLQDAGTSHESVLLVILFHTNFFQFIFLVAINSAFSGEGGSSYDSGGYSSSGSGSSSSYSSSSSSNDTSWSGGGGSFGGGGASSSW